MIGHQHQLSLGEFTGIFHSLDNLFRNSSSPALNHVAPKFNFYPYHFLIDPHCCFTRQAVFLLGGIVGIAKLLCLTNVDNQLTEATGCIRMKRCPCASHTGNHPNVRFCPKRDHPVEVHRILWH